LFHLLLDAGNIFKAVNKAYIMEAFYHLHVHILESMDEIPDLKDMAVYLQIYQELNI